MHTLWCLLVLVFLGIAVDARSKFTTFVQSLDYTCGVPAYTYYFETVCLGVGTSVYTSTSCDSKGASFSSCQLPLCSGNCLTILNPINQCTNLTNPITPRPLVGFPLSGVYGCADSMPKISNDQVVLFPYFTLKDCNAKRNPKFAVVFNDNPSGCIPPDSDVGQFQTNYTKLACQNGKPVQYLCGTDKTCTSCTMAPLSTDCIDSAGYYTYQCGN